MTTAITLLVVALLTLAVCAFIAYLVQAFRDDQIARAMRETGVTPNAAPAPAPPARVPGRAPEDECMRIDCTEPWEVDIHGWKVCRGHDTRRPFDQELTAESVIEAAREITRRAAA